MLLTGEAVLIPELGRSREWEETFAWSDTLILTDYYTLVSRSEHRNIAVNEIMHIKVGMAQNTTHAATFKQWFPFHKNYIEYNSIDAAFNALQKGEVDMVMTTQRRVINLTHIQELVGYKANIVFNQPIETRFAFSRNEAVLHSIVDKAFKLIDTGGIATQWTQKTYDYRLKVVEEQRPWLIGASVLSLAVLSLILVIFFRNRKITAIKSLPKKGKIVAGFLMKRC
jgi:ABC-type amino acid transport substrate-binding protein